MAATTIPITRLTRSWRWSGAGDLGFRLFRGRGLRGGNPLFDERVPLVALRALPEQLGAAIAAVHADVRVEVEHRLARTIDVAAHQLRIEVEAGQRPPERGVHDQAGGVGGGRGEKKPDRGAGTRAGGVVAPERQPRPPVQGVTVDERSTQGD